MVDPKTPARQPAGAPANASGRAAEQRRHANSTAPKTANTGPERLRATDATREQFAGKGRLGNDMQEDRHLGTRRGSKD